MVGRRVLVFVVLPVLLTIAGCNCGGGGIGDACDSTSDCGAGLFCDPDTATCRPVASDSGTDAVAIPDAMGADSTVGSDSGADAMVGTDSGADAAVGTDSGADAMAGSDAGTDAAVMCTLPADCDDGDPCTDDDCNAVGMCENTFNTDPCDDGDACTSNDLCSGGTCAGAAVACGDSNVCTDDTCDSATGCVFTNNTAACDDGVGCTVNDTCSAGACAGTPSACDDGDVCTDDVCDPVLDCVFTFNTDPCDDGDPCTSNDLCSAGTCDGTPAMDGTSCSDGNICNGGESCQSGLCADGTPLSCDDFDPCTADSCDPLAGCSNPVYPDGTSCADFDLCNGIETCVGGTCMGGPIPLCIDFNPCTDDLCDPGLGCVFVANADPCDDGDVCTLIDWCVGGACVGTAFEVCANGLDDDCNGVPDDGCPPLFIGTFVADSGSNLNPCTPFLPCRTIAQGLANRAVLGSGQPVFVGRSPLSVGPAVFAENVVLSGANADAEILGGFDASTWGRDPSSNDTVIDPVFGVAVTFGIGSTGRVDGFRIIGTNFAGPIGSNYAVWFNASTGTLANNVIQFEAGASPILVGVFIAGGGGPLVIANAIQGGDAALEYWGIEIDTVAAVISGNVLSGGTAPVATEIGCLDCAGTLIESNLLTGAFAELEVRGIYAAGDTAGVLITGNSVSGGGAACNEPCTPECYGVLVEDCGGTGPVIDANAALSTDFCFDSFGPPAGDSSGSGVGVFNACDPIITGNAIIHGPAETNFTYGVRCEGSSDCVVDGNQLIMGTPGFAYQESRGVRCVSGCTSVSGNGWITGGAADFAIGVDLVSAGPVVDDNAVYAGFCSSFFGTGSTTGVLAMSSDAMLTNNTIEAGECAFSVGIHHFLATANPTVINNYVNGGGFLAGGGTESVGVRIDVSPGGAFSPGGIYRNNLINGGRSSIRLCIEEVNAFADPAVVENDDLYNCPAALYVDEGITVLLDPADVDALTDITSSGNVSDWPFLVSDFPPGDYHLTAMSSCCIDTGTAAGAPAFDFDGDARPVGAGFDIGADEL